MLSNRRERGLLKWLNGQSIVGSTQGLRTPVAIRLAARYQLRDDPDKPNFRTPAFPRRPDRSMARLSRRSRRRTGLRGARRLHRRAVPERLYPAARRTGADPDR